MAQKKSKAKGRSGASGGRPNERQRMQALMRVMSGTKAGTARITVQDYATLFNRGEAVKLSAGDLVLAEFIESQLKELSALLELETQSGMVLPGYCISFARDGLALSFVPMSGFMRRLDTCCVDDLLQVLDARLDDSVVTWVASGPAAAHPTLVISVSVDGGRCAHVLHGGKLARLSRIGVCEEFLELKYDSDSRMAEPAFGDGLLAMLVDHFAMSQETVNERGESLKHAVRHLLDIAQAPYFHAALAGARLLDEHRSTFAQRLRESDAERENALGALKRRHQDEVERLQSLFAKASKRANEAEAQLRDLKRRGGANKAPTTSAPQGSGLSLGERLSVLF